MQVTDVQLKVHFPYTILPYKSRYTSYLEMTARLTYSAGMGAHTRVNRLSYATIIENSEIPLPSRHGEVEEQSLLALELLFNRFNILKISQFVVQ